MSQAQFINLEIAEHAEKILPILKKKKITFFLLYLITIIYFSLPSHNIPFLQFGRVSVTSLMEQRAIENYLLYFPKQSWISVDEVNPVLLKAIISMEDGKFFSHKGIDWKELKTSMRVNKRRGRTIRGASTITMQLSKNLYLSTSKSILRKAKEFIITFRMEKELSKKTILENYVNIIEWGDGIFGIKKAAQIYFDKHPKDLNIFESSRLAAVIPSPLRHDPTINSGYVNRRSAIIRARLHDVELYPEEKK